MLPEAGEVALDLLGSGHGVLILLFGALALLKKQEGILHHIHNNGLTLAGLSGLE